MKSRQQQELSEATLVLDAPPSAAPQPASDRRVVVRTEGLSRRFGENVAVNQLSFEVYTGEIFGILGHNGAGKTTTVRLLNGILSPSAGSARVLDLDPAVDGPSLRRHTGVLTETPSLDDRLTAWENLEAYANLYDVPQADVASRVTEMLAIFGLAERAGEKVGGYSKGMRQRLALSRALIHRPDLLFLDEPAAGLDPVATRQLHEMILRLSRQEGRTIFLCTHNLAEAQHLCDRVAVLEHGRLIAIGTPAALGEQMGSSLRLELEVDVTQVDRAEQLLAQSGLICEVQGSGAIQVSGAGRERIPEVVNALVAGGVGIYRVALQEPSLEDVYFALHDGDRPQTEGRQDR
jgi:ABC-2 type transport system ATP-binding protein